MIDQHSRIKISRDGMVLYDASLQGLVLQMLVHRYMPGALPLELEIDGARCTIEAPPDIDDDP